MMSGEPGSKRSSSLQDIQDKFKESMSVNVRSISQPVHRLCCHAHCPHALE